MNFSKRKLGPYFISLAEDSCLKSFHRKDALAKFINQHFPSRFQVQPYTGLTTKREYLSSLFLELTSRSDTSGHAFIYEIAKSLVAMKSFPDLVGWEDSEIKINAAKQAHDLLAVEYKKLSDVSKDEQEIARRKKESEKIREKQRSRTDTFQELTTRLTTLTASLGTQDAGYKFEDWFYDLAVYNEIECRRPYKDANGRQIDGSITIDGVTYLVETKFTSKAIGSQDVDIFFNKIKSKADNTMGIMISISGFNDNAIRTASCDRTTIILMDHSHLFNLIIPQVMSFKEAVQRIARNAAQTGNSFLGADNF